jgi:hypothetical protein
MNAQSAGDFHRRREAGRGWILLANATRPMLRGVADFQPPLMRVWHP